jgi:16S rRNA processing protein RimM
MPAVSSQDGGASERVALGRIAGPFGVRGWVKVMSYTDPPEAIADWPVWRLDGAAGAQTCRALEWRRHGKGLVARLEGVADRDAAKALGRREIWIERRELPALPAGQYYREDLVGFEVVNLQGRQLGRVQHFLDAPANPVMVVRGEQEHWLPLVASCLRRVDFGNRRVTVDWDV